MVHQARTPYSNSTFIAPNRLAVVWLAEGGFALDFEIAWLFQVVGVGDEVGFFLGLQGGWRLKQKQEKGQLRQSPREFFEGLLGHELVSSEITTDLVVFSRLKGRWKAD